MTASPLAHATVATARGEASLTDIGDGDAAQIAAYFYSDDPHLDMLLDRSSLPPIEKAAARFEMMRRSGDPAQRYTAFAIRLNGRLVGCSTLTCSAPDTNFSHWHIIDPKLRKSGLSSLLYPHRMKMYFDLFPIERMIHQTKPDNIGVNRMLDKFVPIAETRHEDRPDGGARPGLFNIRYVLRDDLPRIFAAAGLAWPAAKT